jgi:hypothetical protein
MSRLSGRIGSKGILLGALIICLGAGPALAQTQGGQDEDGSRGVRILGAPTPPPGTGNGSPVPTLPSIASPGPPQLTPAPSAAIPILTPPPAVDQPIPPRTQPVIGEIRPAPAPLPADSEVRPIAPAPSPAARPSPAIGAPLPAVPVLIPSRPGPSEGATPSPPSPSPPPASNNIVDLPAQPDGAVRPSLGEIEALSAGLKIPNSAGLAMQILPGPNIAAGSQVSFQVSSKKAGYLILVDVEATGKLVQIYPNPMSLMIPGGARVSSNFLRPGKIFRIPDRENLYSGFEFVASPPAGTALVVAILSDRPVQMVDLPDVPVSLAGRASAVDYLTKLASELRIPDAHGSGRLEEPHWSFDAKFYAIR